MLINKNIKFLKKFKSFLLINKFKNFIEGNSKYIIRLDDACETMNLEKWEKVESILDSLNIKPIVAVIPLNKDSTLKISKKNDYFWELINTWKNKGWQIALHGFEHKYHRIPRRRQFIPLYERSEFACLEEKLQTDKILKGIDILKNNGINPNIWVAPSHSFDQTTIDVLRKKTDIRIISDGISFFPFIKDGMTFLPQQLWKPFKFPFGIWTICLHPNNMNYLEINNLSKELNNSYYKNKFIDVNEINKYKNKLHFLSFIFKRLFLLKIFLKHLLSKK